MNAPLNRRSWGPWVKVIGMSRDGQWLYWYDDRDRTFWKRRRPAKGA